MPVISDQKRDARRTQIVNAARKCFQREGLHATTMPEVIQASGLSCYSDKGKRSSSNHRARMMSCGAINYTPRDKACWFQRGGRAYTSFTIDNMAVTVYIRAI
jgi:hypothetical protein